MANQIEGVNKAVRVLKLLPKNVRRKVLRNAVAKSARVARKNIRARAPTRKAGRARDFIGPNLPGREAKRPRRPHKAGKRDEGTTLKKSIRAVRDNRRGSPTREVYVVDVGKAYWGFFYEKGTSRQPPRPFFVPTFERSTGSMFKVMIDTLAEGVIREAKKLAGPLGSTLRGRGRR